MSVDASSEATFGETMDYFFGVPFPSKRKAAAVQERELKVGDRVSASGGYTFDPIVGVIVGEDGHGAYTVRSNVHLCNQFKDEWFYYKDELTLLPPTFLPGTRVRVVRNTNHYAVGDTGTVTLSSDESVGVVMDNGRYWSFKPEDLAVVESEAIAHLCSQNNPEQETCRITVDATGCITGLSFAPANDPATPCIVIRQVDGQPRPSSWPHVHQSAAGATKEAERLASVNPGKQFDVYQRVTGRVGDVQVREVA